MKNKGVVIWVLVGILFFLTLGVLIYNFICNVPELFSASATQILTIFVALLVAFVATQFRNDQTKNKEHAEQIIGKIQIIVSDDSFYSINSDCDSLSLQKKISMTVRKLNNCISALKQYGSRLGFEEEAAYIESEFNKYKDTTSNHIQDPDYLHKSEIEFRKYSENIDSKCDAIILKLYK